jgi:hypothetical protein
LTPLGFILEKIVRFFIGVPIGASNCSNIEKAKSYRQ